MRFRFIEDHRSVFGVRLMCAVLEVSASGYYAWRSRPESARVQSNRALVDDIHRVQTDPIAASACSWQPPPLGVATTA